MDREHPTELLSDYLDGDLTPAERKAVVEHLAGCGACARTVADLRRIVAMAGALEDRPPTRDLWPGIADRIGADAPRAAPRVVPPTPSRRRFAFTLPQLAAAAAAFLIVGALGVWTLDRDAALPGSGGAPVATGESPEASIDLAAAEAPYAGAIAELERAFAANRDRLDPATVKTVEANLATIDGAIEEIRRALASDPADPWLHSHLARTMQTKVDVLREATQATQRI